MFSELKHQVKESLTMRQMIVVLLILAAALAFVQLGVLEYKKSLEQKTSFQSVETNLIDTYATYRHYASYGFRLLFSPSPISILFGNSAILQDLMANIETGFRMNIYQSMKSSAPFGVNQYLLGNFSGIFLFFGGLLMLFYAYIPFLSTEYLRHLASIAGEKNFFSRFFGSRAIMAALFSLFFLFAAVLVITINGIHISIDKYLGILFLKMVFTAITFILIGAVFGTIKSKAWGLGGAITSWISLLVIVPLLVSIIVNATSGSIKPESQLEIEKLKLMMDHEKRFNNETGILPLNKTPTERQSELVLNYYKNEFQKTQALEEEVKAQMQAHTDFYYMLSAIFPTTSYQALTQEISSRGYKNLYAFYQIVIQIKEAFFKEYMKQVYFSPQPAKVEPFLKGDENIIEGKPALPGYLLMGFCFNLIWIGGLAMLAYYRFKKVLFALPRMDAMPVPSTCQIRIKKEIINSWYANEDFFNNYLYNLLSGVTHRDNKKTYPFTVTLDGQPWDISAGPQNFLYLCPPNEIPGHIKAGDLLDLEMNMAGVSKAKRETILVRFVLKPILKKRFDRLTRDEVGQVMLAILEMKPYDFYLINNIARKMYWEFCYALVEKMHAISEAGAYVLFLTDQDVFMARDIRRRVYFRESVSWIQNVTDFKDIDLNSEIDDGQKVPNSGYQK